MIELTKTTNHIKMISKDSKLANIEVNLYTEMPGNFKIVRDDGSIIGEVKLLTSSGEIATNNNPEKGCGCSRRKHYT